MMNFMINNVLMELLVLKNMGSLRNLTKNNIKRMNHNIKIHMMKYGEKLGEYINY